MTLSDWAAIARRASWAFELRPLGRSDIHPSSDVGLHQNYMSLDDLDYGSYITGLIVLRRRRPATRNTPFGFVDGLSSQGVRRATRSRSACDRSTRHCGLEPAESEIDLHRAGGSDSRNA